MRAKDTTNARARLFRPTAAWKKVALPAEVGPTLRKISSQARRKAGLRVLLSGPSALPAAKIIASDLGLSLYRIPLSAVVSKYIGETEKNLTAFFERAERVGAILFIDEADALFGKRSEVKDAHDRYANLEVSYLLERLEHYQGLAILATNHKTKGGSASVRLFHFLVDLPAER